MQTEVSVSLTDIYVDLGREDEPALIRWSAPSPGGTSRHEGYALVTADGPVLLDPPDPGAAASERLVSLLGARPVATVLTNDWHERGCYVLRERWGTPVWAPAAGLPARGGELEGDPDYLYEEGTALPGGLRARKIDGVFAGEHMLHWQARTGERVLFTGDVVNGQTTERGLPSRNWRDAPGLYLGVAHYYSQWLADPGRLQASLRRLLDEDFQFICGAHARPYGERARDALGQLLAQDWAAVLRTGGRPAVYPRLLEACQYGRRTTFPLVEQRVFP